MFCSFPFNDFLCKKILPLSLLQLQIFSTLGALFCGNDEQAWIFSSLSLTASENKKKYITNKFSEIDHLISLLDFQIFLKKEYFFKHQHRQIKRLVLKVDFKELLNVVIVFLKVWNIPN